MKYVLYGRSQPIDLHGPSSAIAPADLLLHPVVLAQGTQGNAYLRLPKIRPPLYLAGGGLYAGGQIGDQMLGVIELDKLLAIERATVEK